jgi:hypothetical protein
MKKSKSSARRTSRPPRPNPDLETLDRLVGTWSISGEAEGQVCYQWEDGGFFLVQHFDLAHGGRAIRGIEVIGHQQGLGEEPSEEIRSRVYSFLDGLTLDYVYELEGDTLTIWGGEKGSPAYYRGTFRDDGRILAGGWVWPGGGYETLATRVE